MKAETEFERLRKIIAHRDPLVIEAMNEIDRDLLRSGLTLSPRERLQRASLHLARLTKFRLLSERESTK